MSSRAKSPYSVRVESPEAIYMAVPRVRFWEFVNEDSRLLGYVRTITARAWRRASIACAI
ncbi:MAG: hypothetical protein ACLTKG_05220 [Collinsella intestinalis]